MHLAVTDIVAVLTIAALETFLSLDNAIVLALIARKLDPVQQKRALRYGLLGAVVLRIAAVGIATLLIRYAWVKILGGLYLGYLAVSYFLGKSEEDNLTKAHPSFWKTVLTIELMDLAFAVDSILAAVALTQNYWVIVVGGLIGVVVIRFAAQGFIKLLERYPKLETAAYVLIGAVAAKVLYEGAHSFW
jgi:YkoY family integral membrane protein